MTPILYSGDEIDFLNNGLGQLVDLYDVDIHEQRNGLLNLTAYYPVNGQHYADISEGNIILAKPSPLDDNHAFRIVNTQLDISGYAVQIEADSITYDLTHNIVKSVVMQGDGQNAMKTLQNAVLNPSIFTFYSDITATGFSELNFVNPMEAIAGIEGSFLQKWGGELKRENRRVAMFNRRGRDNVATFRLGKNISGLKYTVDTANLVTQIIPTVTITEGDASRYIEGTPVSSKRIGNYPVKYMQHVDLYDVVKVNDGDSDDTIRKNINSTAAGWFTQSENTGKDLPQVTVEVDVLSLQDSADYSDKFAKLETIGLTDTVTVYVPEYGVNVTAIVNELHYDPIGERVTSLVVGTAKLSFADANKSALSDLENKVTQVQEQATQAVTSANGKNTNYYGRNKPAHPQEGDTWFWEDGENSGIKVFKSSDWVDVVDTQTQERITNEVKNAVDTATEYADNLNQSQAEVTNSLAGELTRKANSLSASQQKIASQASAYTDSAVASANANATALAQSTAQNAQSALSAAKTDLTNSIASQASQTASMASEVNSKANQYASQAKSEAIAAATSADGVVRTEFKSTTDSMTATIQQNKSDADGKISTAQTTATQALDGLATKVEKTEYNQRTGELSSKINETSDTAEQSKQDIVDIKETNSKQDNRMLEIEKNAEGIKQTVSDLSTEQGKQSGYISTLQQRADGFEATVTKVNNLAVGGRNLLLDTGRVRTGTGTNTGNLNQVDFRYTLAGNQNTSTLQKLYGTGTAITISFDWEVKGSTVSGTFLPQWQSDPWGMTDSGASSVTISSTNTSGHYVWSSKIPSKWANFTANVIGLRVDYLNGVLTLRNFKFETGNVATDWTPAPEDVDSAVAKAQLTADNATLSINNYKTDADGRISKAQADIKVNADNISTKVEKSDYDKKTGDLTTSVNKAQQIADTATQTIGTYKTSNDNRVSAAETAIKANSDAIKLTVSKTDFDQATGKLSGDISTLQQRANGFEATVTKVNNLAVGGRNLLLGTSISFTGIGNNSINGTFNDQGGQYYLAGGKKVSDLYNQYGSSGHLTLSFDWAASGSTLSGEFLPQWNGTPWGGLSDAGNIKISNTNTSGHYKTAVSLDNHDFSIGTAAGIRFRQDNLQGNVTISNVKLEAGNVATDWTPAPEDVDTQLAQVKLTADGVYQTVNNPQTGLNTRVSTAEGNITKVQGAVGSMSTTVTQTADGLTREIADRKTGDSNTLQAGKDFTTSQIKSYDTGMQSRLSQTSDAILAKVGATNLFPNSEFNANYGYRQKDGNTTLSLATKNNIDGAYNGTVSVSSTGPSYQGYWANNIPVQGGQKYSASVKVHYTNGGLTNGVAVLDLWFIDSTGARISNASSGTSQVSSPFWVRLVSEGFTAPTNAVYLQMNLLVNNAGAGQVAVFTQPMVTATEKLQQYTPNNDISAQLSLFKDNWSIGINDNAGALISGINGDTSGMTIAAKKLTVSADTTFLGNNWLNGAIIKNASIGGAQIAKASITDANILNLDVNKISGEVANFIRAYWDGQYGSTSITSEGMTVTAGVTTTVFDENGMQLNKSSRSIGRIGVNDLYQDNSKKGLYFGLESTGDFMAWGAQNYAGNPYDTKLSWYRVGSVPSNLPGTIEGFNFQDNVLFNRPLEMRGGIKIQGTDDKLVAKTTTFNGFNYPTFGTSSAGLAYGSVETYLISNGTAYNLSKIIKALSGISSAAIPSGFTSDGKATGWYNINFK
ncbi:phage tail spike protein [Weissella confusa]